MYHKITISNILSAIHRSQTLIEPIFKGKDSRLIIRGDDDKDLVASKDI